jgi:hypothetical protein
MTAGVPRGRRQRRRDCGIDRLPLGTLHWTPHRSSCSPKAAHQRLGQHGTTTVCGNGRVDAGPFSVEVAGTWQESVSVVVGTSAAQGPGRGVVDHVPVCQGASEVDGRHGLARARLALASRQTSDARSRCWTRCDVVKTLATRTYALTRMLLDIALLQRSALPANRTQRRRLAASRAAGRAVAGAGCAADEWPRLAAIEHVA